MGLNLLTLSICTKLKGYGTCSGIDHVIIAICIENLLDHMLYLEFAGIITAQSIDLLPSGKSLCLGQQAVFTCVATVTGILSWASDCFIGNNGRSLSFPSNTPPEYRINSTLNQNNYAVLNSVCNDTGTLELNSTLHVQVEELVNETCTVLCKTSDGLQKNVTVQILGTCTCNNNWYHAGVSLG